MKCNLIIGLLWAGSLLPAAAVNAMQAPEASAEFSRIARLEAHAAQGRELYEACVSCHGRDGSGNATGYVPVIAEQHQRVIAKQLIDYRHADRWDPRMEAVSGRHNLPGAQDIANLAAYVSRLPRAQNQGHGDGGNVEAGKRIFARDCAGCHGLEAEGNGVLLVPRLAGQHYSYLLRQLHDTLEERRPNMPPPHQQLLGGLDADELTGIADHLSRIQPSRHVVR